MTGVECCTFGRNVVIDTECVKMVGFGSVRIYVCTISHILRLAHRNAKGTQA